MISLVRPHGALREILPKVRGAQATPSRLHGGVADLHMQKSYLLLAIAFQKGIRESVDPQRFAETVTKKQFEELCYPKKNPATQPQ